MTSRTLVTRLALLACSTLGCIVIVTPAQARIEPEGIPTGAPRSPLLNGATQFSRPLLLLEELGAKSLATDAMAPKLPVPATCTESPTSAAVDKFLKKPMWPAPREFANDQDQNPWLAKVNACLGYGLAKSPIEGRPPGEYFGHQRYNEFYPSIYVQTAMAGARANTGLRDAEQRHGFAIGTFLGSYVEHCHNTTHEDYAMMLWFDVLNPAVPMLIKAPMPSWSGVTPSPLCVCGLGT